MLDDRIVYLSGSFVPWDAGQVHLMSHSVGRGSAIFEVLSLHDTPGGPAAFRLDRHIERFFQSAAFLNMEMPLSKEALQQGVLETVSRNKVRNGAIKIIAFYPQISFSILPPQKKLDIAVFVIDPAQDFGGMKLAPENGTTLGLSTWRKLDPQTIPIAAKAAANYLNGMIARQEVAARGFKNVVMLDTQGFIAEGGTESIFLVKAGKLLTPALGTVLGSITRESILEAAPKIGIETSEARLHPDLLNEADEMFLSGTPMKVLPVRKFEDRIFDAVPGPVTRKIAEFMENVAAGRDDRFRHWIFL